ncbi:hypothetical protein KX75_20175 [Salmonella enterica subsp. enterica]|nr:hypothetical protein [Salmonella enterica subsp. enterica serovar Mikawasima]EDN7229191.1 hypothetical protein [Salmonella enterica subsp. enterica serovar Mikawasima]
MHRQSGKPGHHSAAHCQPGRRDDEWPKTFRPMTLTIRGEFAAEAGQANVRNVQPAPDGSSAI